MWFPNAIYILIASKVPGKLFCKKHFIFLCHWIISLGCVGNFLNFYLFIHFSALLALHCCSGFSLFTANGGYSLVAVQGLLIVAAAAAKSLQSCPTLCNPIDGSPPGSPIPGILQARTLEWVAISFSNAGK